MLPTYANDSVHHRHGQPATGFGGRPVSNLLHNVPRQRRAVIHRVLQVALLLLVLLPLTLLMPNYAPWSLLQASSRRADLTNAYAGDEGGSDGVTAEAAAQRRQQHQRQAVATASSSTAASGRKMMTEAVPLPGAHLKHLILVAGHAVYVGRDYSEANLESSWFLEDYQKVPGEAASFLDHIELGIKEAAADPEAMLLFSGGQTRLAAGPRSEGLSYWVVAEAAGWFNASGVRNRTFTEEHARDSFENLLFSLCRFYELSGHYPDRVTVVSYNLKRRRFQELHRAALRFPDARFKFVGNEIPPAAKGALEGEARTVESFKQDMYGCSGELLQKKLRRDPFAVGPPHPSRCPALKGLLAHCGAKLYAGRLPWT